MDREVLKMVLEGVIYVRWEGTVLVVVVMVEVIMLAMSEL